MSIFFRVSSSIYEQNSCGDNIASKSLDRLIADQ